MSELMEKLETLKEFAYEYAEGIGQEIRRSDLQDQLNEQANLILGDREDKTYTVKDLITLLSQFDDDQEIYYTKEEEGKLTGIYGLHVECASRNDWHYCVFGSVEEGRLLICLLGP